MKYLATAIALAIAAPAAAFDNHEAHGESHDHMVCCDGTTEERDACRERHQAMGHEMADCDGDHHMNHGDDANESDDEDHSSHSDDPAGSE
ncbi:hypothetical protein [Parasphingopyxis lamellibrachiae]|uniref:Pentapeptide MXKDX repeat protein n=1 Tax=Parasphingopyxis lamellibrachiae TaxID=680125 RepID=A0A3D9FGK2_9SPHN|nr:hypothetical protein [Parasphingopyxis lamellibrachiae]RED16667.1 hypothetical protein DFR46_1694 [Parasphingopyxis lamellibrachiae]